MVKTIVWNVKGQINSEYRIIRSNEEEYFLDEELGKPEIYGVKTLEGENYPKSDEDGSLWLDNRRVG